MLIESVGVGKVQQLQNIKLKDVAKYTLLPGVIPRVKAFFGSGFGWVATLMAQIYCNFRLLPPDHPYLNPANQGRFGIRHVIVEAANNLVFKKENIDQIIIFFTLILGFFLLILQFFALIFMLVIRPVFAGSLFITPGCENAGAACPDIAFILLDLVFAVPDFFNSTQAPANIGAVPPFNRALQNLFQYYNHALLIVGVVILLYYVLVVVGETANTGTPFGRRFSHIYAPLRLVFAIGLLVPITLGYNSAQYLTLYAAKVGSSMATNGWNTFNNALTDETSPIGTRREQLLARPRAPSVGHIAAFMSVVQTCRAIYEMKDGTVIAPFMVRGEGAPLNRQLTGAYTTNAALYNDINDDDSALGFYNGQDVVIVFGEPRPGENYLGGIKPTCGKITVPTSDVMSEGALTLQYGYFRSILTSWFGTASPGGALSGFGGRLANIHILDNGNEGCDAGGFPAHAGAVDIGSITYVGPAGTINIPTATYNDPCDQLPDAEFKPHVYSVLNSGILQAAMAAYNIMVADTEMGVIPDELLERGWAGAGIWYNRIAEYNGILATVAVSSPVVSAMPMLMEEVERQKRAGNQNITAMNRFQPFLEGLDEEMKFTEGTIDMARALNEAYEYWTVQGQGRAPREEPSGNVIFDVLNVIMGAGGLYDMRFNHDIHPLAQLSSIGKSIVETAVRNLMASLVFSAGGGASSIMEAHALTPALDVVSGFFMAATTMGLAIGFMLYYVLPFLPFMYFFFAVGGWIKSIFEAMIGVPLWALAHLRIDGNGFPGDSASNGYFLLFEIFVRPILTVFGLIASVAIFSAMARTLTEIFDLVTENVAGFSCPMDADPDDCTNVNILGPLMFKRGVIDEFFFTIVYTIVVYMIATSSFKLIDQIPNSILRWMGAGVQSFNDQRDDVTGSFTQYAAFGGATISGQVVGAANQGARAAGQAAGAVPALALRYTRGTNVDGRSAPPSGGSS